jgi:hypothetical protein
MKAYGHPLPELAYTDKCCEDSGILKKNIPSLAANLKNLQEVPLPEDKVKVLSTKDDVDACLEPLLQRLDAGKITTAGLDCEWDPSFDRVLHKVSVLQLAFMHPDGKVLLILVTNFRC